MNDDQLTLRGISSGYGDTTVLRDVSLTVSPGEVVAVLGANGAGKTTLLRTIAGVIAPTAGSILIGADDLTRSRPNARVRNGICLIPEGRGVFPSLTVKENLRLAIPPWIKSPDLSVAIDAFPALGNRLEQVVGTMSGGQQQMVSISRCYLSRPSFVLLDEVSMGLAPLVVDEIFVALKKLAASGMAMILVEQYVHRALEMADTVHLMARGRLTFSGRASEVNQEDLEREYFGAELST